MKAENIKITVKVDISAIQDVLDLAKLDATVRSNDWYDGYIYALKRVSATLVEKHMEVIR